MRSKRRGHPKNRSPGHWALLRTSHDVLSSFHDNPGSTVPTSTLLETQTSRPSVWGLLRPAAPSGCNGAELPSSRGTCVPPRCPHCFPLRGDEETFPSQLYIHCEWPHVALNVVSRSGQLGHLWLAVEEKSSWTRKGAAPGLGWQTGCREAGLLWAHSHRPHTIWAGEDPTLGRLWQPEPWMQLTPIATRVHIPLPVSPTPQSSRMTYTPDWWSLVTWSCPTARDTGKERMPGILGKQGAGGLACSQDSQGATFLNSQYGFWGLGTKKKWQIFNSLTKLKNTWVSLKYISRCDLKYLGGYKVFNFQMIQKWERESERERDTDRGLWTQTLGIVCNCAFSVSRWLLELSHAQYWHHRNWQTFLPPGNWFLKLLQHSTKKGPSSALPGLQKSPQEVKVTHVLS